MLSWLFWHKARLARRVTATRELTVREAMRAPWEPRHAMYERGALRRIGPFRTVRRRGVAGSGVQSPLRLFCGLPGKCVAGENPPVGSSWLNQTEIWF